MTAEPVDSAATNQPRTPPAGCRRRSSSPRSRSPSSPRPHGPPCSPASCRRSRFGARRSASPGPCSPASPGSRPPGGWSRVPAIAGRRWPPRSRSGSPRSGGWPPRRSGRSSASAGSTPSAPRSSRTSAASSPASRSSGASRTRACHRTRARSGRRSRSARRGSRWRRSSGGMVGDPWRSAFLDQTTGEVVVFLVAGIASLTLSRLTLVGSGPAPAASTGAATRPGSGSRPCSWPASP